MKPWQWLLLGGGVYLLTRLAGKVELWEKLEFSLANVTPGISGGRVFLDCTFKLNNKTSENLTVNSIDGWIQYKETNLAQITATQPQVIHPGESTFQIKLRPQLGGTVDMIRKLIEDHRSIKQDFYFNGTVTIEGVPVTTRQKMEW